MVQATAHGRAAAGRSQVPLTLHVDQRCDLRRRRSLNQTHHAPIRTSRVRSSGYALIV
jgi:hypothetical protein